MFKILLRIRWDNTLTNFDQISIKKMQNNINVRSIYILNAVNMDNISLHKVKYSFLSLRWQLYSLPPDE